MNRAKRTHSADQLRGVRNSGTSVESVEETVSIVGKDNQRLGSVRSDRRDATGHFDNKHYKPESANLERWFGVGLGNKTKKRRQGEEDEDGEDATEIPGQLFLYLTHNASKDFEGDGLFRLEMDGRYRDPNNLAMAEAAMKKVLDKLPQDLKKKMLEESKRWSKDDKKTFEKAWGELMEGFESFDFIRVLQ